MVKPNQLPQLPRGDWIGIGSAFDSPALGSLIETNYKDMIRTIIRSALPCAHDVAAIAHRQWQLGIGLARPDQAVPLYLRNNVAQTIAQRAEEKTSLQKINLQKTNAEANCAVAQGSTTIAQSTKVDGR